ncbi:MAG TPA: NUDIX pyrophosphatase [Rhodothermales bacterium]|nr:NUDIX pyrophosphatase [Bacteroidota bacterium]HRK73046.1 NUDIX pyrophosphatase [Rhodothermales bacterium]HRR10326.1 NUDIX pyrophosphatase [Rhodothermales bacterium]
MTQNLVRVVDVYPYRLMADGYRFLLLRRAVGTLYAGQWRMVGGKIQQDETAWQAALRELIEETGYPPQTFWALPSVNTFYNWKLDAVLLTPAFAAELERDPTLNHEHDRFGWFSTEEALRLLVWEEQKRLLSLTNRYLQTGTILPDWIIPHM